jgi:hypothetical protein
VKTNIFRFGIIDQVSRIPLFPTRFPELIEMQNKKDLIEQKFIEVFAKRGNYSMNFVYFDHQQTDLTHFTSLFKENAEVLHTGSVFFEESYVTVVPPSEPYSSYEKMILPFDLITWILIALTFALAHFFIFITRIKNKVYNLIADENMKTPNLDLYKIFFGVSQTQLPEKNFGRIFLISFIFFCLVLRTGYQGEFLMDYLGP